MFNLKRTGEDICLRPEYLVIVCTRDGRCCCRTRLLSGHTCTSTPGVLLPFFVPLHLQVPY